MWASTQLVLARHSFSLLAHIEKAAKAYIWSVGKLSGAEGHLGMCVWAMQQ